MCAVAVGKAKIETILIIRIGRMAEMEKKSGNFDLLQGGEGRNALLNVFNAHIMKIRELRQNVQRQLYTPSLIGVEN